MLNSLQTYQIHFDGGCRPNPGEMSSAYIIRNMGGVIISSECIKGGHGTSNVAEYIALHKGLEKAIELGIKHIEIYGDSQLVIQQINGTNQAKNAKMKYYRDSVRELLKKFHTYKLLHIPRKFNQEADKLSWKGE